MKDRKRRQPNEQPYRPLHTQVNVEDSINQQHHQGRHYGQVVANAQVDEKYCIRKEQSCKADEIALLFVPLTIERPREKKDQNRTQDADKLLRVFVMT